MKSFALALGAGGARGLAHIAVFEVLDELGVKPTAISGSSIGAPLGAAYAAGMSTTALRRHVLERAYDQGGILRRLMAARATPWTSVLRVPLGANPMLLDADKFCAAFLPAAVPDDFDQLEIPLLLVAADLHAAAEVVFSHGKLRPAIAASMAIPGLVQPVIMGGRVLIDGAAVDPLPFTQLAGRAEVVIAVDCSGDQLAPDRVPDAWNTLFASLGVMGQTITAEKLRHGAPDLLLRPNVGIFRLFDFLQATAIIRAAETSKEDMRRQIVALLEG